MFFTFKMGLLLGLSIIISIGAQNLFLIKQGLRNEYPYLCASVCFLCDVILITLGVMGINTLIFAFPFLKYTLLTLGVIFLIYYGYSAIRRGFNKVAINTCLDELRAQKNIKMSVAKLILLALSFSLLNPQAILDTTMIIASNANHYNDPFKYFFVSGAMAASFIWFFGVAVGSSYFGKNLMNVKFWIALEFISGIIMIAFAIKFLLQLL